MRLLLPPDPAVGGRADDVDPLDVYGSVDRTGPASQPWVLVNMIASADGGTAVGGASGRLGGAADKRVFAAIRSLADVIVAGAATVRAEGYGPPRSAAGPAEGRRARGQAPSPRMAVVSGRLDLDPASPLFTGVDQPTIICTVEQADPSRRLALEAVADVVTAGAARVDPGAAMAALAERGASVVLVEGGPTLNAQMLAADLVDELCLTVAPMVVGGRSARITAGEAEAPLTFDLAHVLEEDGTLFLHYLRRR